MFRNRPSATMIGLIVGVLAAPALVSAPAAAAATTNAAAGQPIASGQRRPFGGDVVPGKKRCPGPFQVANGFRLITITATPSDVKVKVIVMKGPLGQPATEVFDKDKFRGGPFSKQYDTGPASVSPCTRNTSPTATLTLDGEIEFF